MLDVSQGCGAAFQFQIAVLIANRRQLVRDADARVPGPHGQCQQRNRKRVFGGSGVSRNDCEENSATLVAVDPVDIAFGVLDGGQIGFEIFLKPRGGAGDADRVGLAADAAGN